MTPPPVLLVMGVSGSGKTTVGKALAGALAWPFQEGDDLHPPANIAKMAAGQPLTDDDRAPWLAAIARWLDGQAIRGEPGVITCSALKRAYRDTLRKDRPQLWLVFLEGSRSVLAERLARRHGHFMPPSMLDSQLADLETPGEDEPVIDIDIEAPVEDQVSAVETVLGEALM
jgi:carbohydrate kinase (thermoresistant glucokinase family)